MEETTNRGELSSTLHAYLRNIGKTPRITPEKEIELARRIQNGDEEARQTMIKSNLRLVVKIAGDYAAHNVPWMDLIAEGNLGLIKAAERFEPGKGAKFSTYAAWWIRQAVRRGLAHQSRTIRLPMHLVDKIQKMRRVSYRLAHELGREPTEEDIASAIGRRPSKVRAWMQAMIPPLSLDAAMQIESEDSTLAEVVSDEKTQNPMDTISCRDLSNAASSALKALDQREMKIISLRFGLKGNKQHTLAEIGRQLQLTRERIRQLQKIALTKMRNFLSKQERHLLVCQALLAQPA
ncbi:MAG: RNA polymerase sigma factor RpoD/SigA [bacterium]